MIPTKLSLLYDSTNASIPGSFSRLTALDSKYPKCATSSLLTTGGSATHSHTGATHSHSASSHTHTSDGNTSGYGTSGEGRTTDNVCGYHSHSITLASASYSGNALSNATAYPSANNLPASYGFIFIKADTYSLIPNNACVIRSSARADFTFHSGSAGKHIVGSATGADAGVTSGAANHNHSLNHTHSAVSHTHSGNTGGYTGDLTTSGSGGSNPKGSHSHSYSIEQSLTGNAYSGNCPDYSNEPATRSVYIYKNETGVGMPLKEGDILIATDTDEYFGWVDCDGTNNTPTLTSKFIKNAATSETALADSGSNTHSHAASNEHSHTHSHNHGGSAYTNYTSGSYYVNGGSYSQVNNHRHQITNISTTNQTWGNATMASESADNQPPYVLVRFVMATKQALGGAYYDMMAAMA